MRDSKEIFAGCNDKEKENSIAESESLLADQQNQFGQFVSISSCLYVDNYNLLTNAHLCFLFWILQLEIVTQC